MPRTARLLGAAFALAAGVAGGARTPVNDDHGTGLEATLLPLGRPLSGSLSGAGDVDAFRIDLTGAARVEVRTSGGTDTRGRLLDADGGLTARDDDGGPGGHNFRIVAALEPGVHYLEVSGAAGDYSVVAVLADAVDHGDTAAASTPLALHDERAPGGTAPDILLGSSGRIWPTVSDVDVFRLDVPFHANVTVRSSGSRALRVRLVDSSLADVPGRADILKDRHGNVRLKQRLDEGTYYVVVQGDELGAYRLLATLGPDIHGCWEPSLATPRDDGGAPESSTLLAVGGPPAVGEIADDADVDVFRLDVHGRAKVEVRTTGRTPTRGVLYDVGGTLVASGEASGSNDRNFRIEAEVAAGTFYVAVTGARGARGEYAVSARAGGAFDHPDAPRTATRLRLHDDLDLARASPDMLLGTAGRIWPSAADVDAFRLDVPRDGTVVRVRTSGRAALHARLVHAGDPSAAIAFDDRGGDIDLEAPLDAGVYYLLLGGRDTGAYRVLARGYEAGNAPRDKAAFDELVAGRTLSALDLETVRFGDARRFAGTLDKAHRSGRYAYEKARCPHVGWLYLDYDDGGRCEVALWFDARRSVHPGRGLASFSCAGASRTSADFWLLDGEEEVAQIRDWRLRRVIRDALSRGEPITVRDMKFLESLRADRELLRDLGGLEHATRLTSLHLRYNDIADLSPLENLTALTSLRLGFNEIADLSPLAGLTALTDLQLEHNDIADLSPLAGLTALTRLDLRGNEISDLSPLAGLTRLRNLDLSENPGIPDLSPLAGLTTLENLDLSENPGISDLSPMAGLAGLTELDLSHTSVSDLSGLEGATALTVLRLPRNRIRDVSPLSGLAALGVLDLRDNDVSDLSPLARLTSLTALHLASNDVSDLSALAGLTSLTRLRLASNHVSDLSPLAGLAALMWLDASDNQGISDLRPLAGLTALERLDLADNRVTDLSPLARLAALERLDLGNNDISDPSPLSALTALQFLHLRDNRIADVSPLSGLNLLWLDLSHNRIRDVSPLAGLTSLIRLYLAGNLISDASPLSALGRAQSNRYGRGLDDLDLSHNEIVELGGDLTANWLRLAGNRIADLTPLLPYLPYYLNLEANAITSLPPASHTYNLTEVLLLGGNALADIDPLLAYCCDDGDDGINLTVSVWPFHGGGGLRRRGATVVGDSQLVPFLVDPLGDPRRRPFVRLVSLNPAERGADAWFYPATPETWGRPAGVVVRGRSAVHVDAADLVGGNRAKRVYGRIPIRPDTALEVYSRGVRAYTYMGTPDGFLTGMQDFVRRSADGKFRVPLFHSADSSGTGVLRLVNAGGGDAYVSIEGLDDAGVRHGPAPARLVLRAGTATVLTSRELESGTGAGLSRGLGDGTGHWRLVVSSPSSIAVASLYGSPTGHLTNLSTTARDNVVPLLPRASDPFRQGVVRVANGGDAATDVRISGVDDAGAMFGPVTVSLAARGATQFTSHDWEHGNPSAGLSVGVGAGTGDWRLRFSGGADIQVSAYVETGDGFVSSLHDVAPGACAGGRHPMRSRWRCWRSLTPPGTGRVVVATFNPASDEDNVSSLRLVNDGDDLAMVAITGYDDRGREAGPVRLEIAAGAARTFTSRQLEQGAEGLAGALGDGAGKWELVVSYSGGPITVVNLLESRSGYITNLSTAPHHGIVGYQW